MSVPKLSSHHTLILILLVAVVVCAFVFDVSFKSEPMSLVNGALQPSRPRQSWLERRSSGGPGLFDYSNDRFIPCPDANGPNANKDDNWMMALAQVQLLLDRTGVPAMIFFGTMIGWLRDCSFLNHTSDIDFAAEGRFATPEWLALIRKVYEPHLVAIFSEKANRSLELRFYVRGVQVDLFFLYPLPIPANATAVDAPKEPFGFYAPGVQPGKQIRWVFHNDQQVSICRSHLRVPCDAEQIVKQIYGPGWRTPIPQKDWQYSRNPKNLVKFPPPKGAGGIEWVKRSAGNLSNDDLLIKNYIAKYPPKRYI